MATTIPTEFEGTPTLTDEKVALLKQWYESAFGNRDHATDGCEYYAGAVDCIEDVLGLLYDQHPEASTTTPNTDQH